jgi:hypothetical protein
MLKTPGATGLKIIRSGGRRKTDIRLPINILDDRGEATEARGVHRRSKFQEEFTSLPFDEIESKKRVGEEKVFFIYLLTGMKGRDQQYNGTEVELLPEYDTNTGALEGYGVIDPMTKQRIRSRRPPYKLLVVSTENISNTLVAFHSLHVQSIDFLC